ncbi:MAG: hypothetical protein ACYCX4_06620 [Bacillota bacterium]
MFRLIKKDDGAALLATFIIITVVLTLGTFLLELSTTESIISRNQVNEVKAMYVAEGGAEKLLADLETEKIWEDSWENEYAGYAIGDGYIESLVITDEPATVRGTVWGAVGDPGSVPRSRRALVSRISKPVYNFALVLLDANSGWSMPGTMEITGDVAVDGNLMMESGASITGNLVVDGNCQNMTGGNLEQGSVLIGGNLNNSGTFTVTGEVVEVRGNLTNNGSVEAPGGKVVANGNLVNDGYIRGDYDFGRIVRAGYLTGNQLQPKPAPVLSLFPVKPDVDLSWYGDHATVKHSGLYQVTGGALDNFEGIIFVDGDLIIASSINASKNLLFAVTGDAYIQGNMQAEGDRGLAVIAGGNIFTESAVHLEGIYMSQDFQAGDSLEISGSIVSQALAISPEGAQLTYSREPAISLAGWLPDYSYELVLWQDLYPIFY